jgi:Holliday junction resolvase RusA-like endonuclease
VSTPTLVLAVHIPGEPRGQGSLRLVTSSTGKEQASYSNEVVNHRNLAVGILAKAWRTGAMPGPIGIRATFTFPRPASHYLPAGRAGRTERELREDAPDWHTNQRDLDKLLRLILDAGTIARIYEDDGQVVLIRASKVYGDVGGSEIEVHEL